MRYFVEQVRRRVLRGYSPSHPVHGDHGHHPADTGEHVEAVVQPAAGEMLRLSPRFHQRGGLLVPPGGVHGALRARPPHGSPSHGLAAVLARFLCAGFCRRRRIPPAAAGRAHAVDGHRRLAGGHGVALVLRRHRQGSVGVRLRLLLRPFYVDLSNEGDGLPAELARPVGRPPAARVRQTLLSPENLTHFFGETQEIIIIHVEDTSVRSYNNDLSQTQSNITYGDA